MAKLEKDAVVTDDVAQRVSNSMSDIADQIKGIKAQIDKGSEVSGILAQGMGEMAKAVAQPQRKPSKMELKKGQDKKTSAVIVHYSDGTKDEMPVSR